MQRNRSNTIEISPEANIKLEGARQALASLRKTFQHWVMIGEGIAALRSRAIELGGRKTFHRLLEQQGLGTFVKSKAVTSRLEKIMQPQNLPKVQAWFATLTEKQQIEWSSPGSVLNHCPVFAKPKPSNAQGTTRPMPSTTVTLTKEVDRLEARVQELEEELESSRKQPSVASKTATPKTKTAKTPLTLKQTGSDGHYWAHDGGKVTYAIDLREGTNMALFGGGKSKPFKHWEINKVLGNINIPWKFMPDGKEPDAKREARKQVNKKLREQTLQKALAVAQRDYERYE